MLVSIAWITSDIICTFAFSDSQLSPIVTKTPKHLYYLDMILRIRLDLYRYQDDWSTCIWARHFGNYSSDRRVGHHFRWPFVSAFRINRSAISRLVDSFLHFFHKVLWLGHNESVVRKLEDQMCGCSRCMRNSQQDSWKIFHGEYIKDLSSWSPPTFLLHDNESVEVYSPVKYRHKITEK